MLTLPYSAVGDFFAAKGIDFVWRGGPGRERDARLTMIEDIRLEPFSLFITDGSLWSMGAFSYSQSTLPPETRSGRYCSFAHAISVFQSEHPAHFISTSPFAYRPEAAAIFERAIAEAPEKYQPCPYDDRETAPIVIGHDVWIGQHTLLKKGIVIGDGAVVAAGSVVTRDVAPFMMVGGVPAKPIRRRFSEKVSERIRELCWWQYRFTDFNGLDCARPEAFLDGLEKKIALGRIRAFEPEPVTLPSLKEYLERAARGA
ncbi:MAG: CatB-related O-acetyltransferase [Desulfovibrionaceae bacterium]|nr:CatB-related O-acetyltransferase [Desulfovibrionaceae bacterium]